MRKLQLLMVLATVILLAFPVRAQEQTPHTLLWKINGDDLPGPSYLFGTIHVREKRVFDFNDSVMVKLNEVDAYAMEVLMDDDIESEIAGKLMLEEGQTLQDLYTPQEYKTLKKFFSSKLNIDISSYDHMKPFVLLTLLSAYDIQFTDAMSIEVDRFLLKLADKAGKQLLGIETLDEQLNMFDEISHDMLLYSVEHYDEVSDGYEKLVDAYTKEDLDQLFKYITESPEMEGSVDKMIFQRNITMADRMVKMAREQTTFFAVGAGHLPGKDGIIDLLKRKGYTVTPVVAPHTIGIVPDLEDEDNADVRDERREPKDEDDVPLSPEVKVHDNEVNYDHCSIQFRGTPTCVTKSTNVQDQDMIIHLCVYREGSLGYIFSITDLTTVMSEEDLSSEMLQAMYEGSLSSFLYQLKGKVDKKQKVNIAGHEGLDVLIKTDDGQARIQMVVVSGSLYMILVTSNNGKLNRKETDAFFNSFREN